MIKKQYDKKFIKQSYIVAGLSDFGKHIVRALALTPTELLVIDQDPKRLEDISDIVLDTVCADAADPDVLSQLGISGFDGAVVDTENDLERKVLITMQLKELGVPNVIVKVNNELEGRVLRRVGADRVIEPDREVSSRVANQIAGKRYFEAIELPPDYSISDFAVPADWFGKTIGDLEIRTKHGMTVLGVHRGEDLLVNPTPNFALQRGDVAVLLGEVGQMNQLRDRYK